jgi:hypothetical protein
LSEKANQKVNGLDYGTCVRVALSSIPNTITKIICFSLENTEYDLKQK